MADALSGVIAEDRWNSSTFFSDLRADKLLVGAIGGGASSPPLRERDDGTNSDRCLFGLLALCTPARRGIGGGSGSASGSRKSRVRRATPSVEFRVGSGLGCSVDWLREWEGE